MPSYIALVHKDPDSDYGVSFPDLPGCITAGLDLEDALRMASEALGLHLAGMSADGDDIPEPSTLDMIMADPVNHDGEAILVEAEAIPMLLQRVEIQ